MIYTLTLNPTLDYIMRIGKIRHDDINRVDSAEFIYGGKGINVSAMVERLGFESRALGFVAGFSGGEFLRLVAKDGVHCDFTELSRGCTRINVKIRTDHELDFNAAGPEVSDEELADLFSKLDRITDGDTLVLSGSVPKNLPPDLYETIIRRYADRDIRVVADAEGDLLLRLLRYKPYLIKPNHHELGRFFGVVTETDGEIDLYARKLQEMGARNVLVSRAEKGSRLYDEEGGVHSVDGIKGELVDSIGCGDSLLAGFLAGRMRGYDYEKALMLGAACGTATAFCEGLGSVGEIEKYFRVLTSGK